MPAIRHKTNGVMDILPQISTSSTWSALILSRDGELVPVDWLGFICNAGTRFLEGGIAKLSAHQISDGDGLVGTDWVMVPKGEYVLCWRVTYLWCKTTPKIGIYGIIDDEGWPITTGGQPVKPRREKPSLIEFKLRSSSKPIV